MTALLVELRNNLYTQIALKKLNTEYVFNGFTLEKAWRIQKTLEQLKGLSTGANHGILYLVCGVPSEWTLNARSKSNTPRTYAVQLCYQRYLEESLGITVGDQCTQFVQELEQTLIDMTDPNGFSLSSIEYLRDPQSGLPIRFASLREASTFEANLTAHYTYVMNTEQ